MSRNLKLYLMQHPRVLNDSLVMIRIIGIPFHIGSATLYAYKIFVTIGCDDQMVSASDPHHKIVGSSPAKLDKKHPSWAMGDDNGALVHP